MLSLGFTLFRGTTFSGLLEGVLIGPVQHPARFAIPLETQPPHAGVERVGPRHRGCIRMGRPPGAHSTRPRRGPREGRGRSTRVVDRLLRRFKSTTLSVALPLVWTAVATATPGRAIGRHLLVLMAVLQSLHAYPIAGSQMSWATFLLLPVGATALADAVAWIQERRPHWIVRIGASPAFPGVLVAGVLLCVRIGLIPRQLRFRAPGL